MLVVYSGLHLYEEAILGFPLPLRERDRVRGKAVATNLLIQTKSAVLWGSCYCTVVLSGKSKVYGSFRYGNSCHCFVGRCFPSISRDRDRRDSPPEIRGDASYAAAENLNSNFCPKTSA